MIRRCTDADVPAIHAIINEAAEAYRGVIPADCWHEPYMSREALAAELAAGVEFAAWERDGDVLGVMGLQVVRDVTLIRHAYVRRAHQGEGIGGALLEALRAQSKSRLLVGTWADARWAIRFYERHGFQLAPNEEKDRLLDRYWNIPVRQRDTSVVLVDTRESTTRQGSSRVIAMNTLEITSTLTTLFGELLDGPPGREAYMLNGGDAGLLRSLDKLSARDASVVPPGGAASIAAHVDHLRYGLSLMNRWAGGDNPFGSADWSTSWRKTSVTDTEWQQLRTDLSVEARRWLEALRAPRDVGRMELNGVVGSIGHLAYHLGAIRQIDRAARGPADPKL